LKNALAQSFHVIPGLVPGIHAAPLRAHRKRGATSRRGSPEHGREKGRRVWRPCLAICSRTGFPVTLPEEGSQMPKPQKSSVQLYRQRMKRMGLVRVEVQARKEDVALVRGVAAALADPAREAEIRAVLREVVASPAPGSLKALLAAAPLEDVNLERSRDLGRDVAF
jgi:hypothetical protein